MSANQPPVDLPPEILAYFDKRLDLAHIHRRIQIERYLDARMGPPQPLRKRLRSIRTISRVGLWMCGMRRLGQRNATRIRLEENTFQLPAGANGLAGLRILQLSDLHIDANPQFAAALIDALQGVSCDVTLITGDFRARTFGPFDATVDLVERIAPHLPNIGGRCYAIAGNHDALSMIPPLERLGIRFLINESVGLNHNGQRLLISGVDEPSFRTDDIGACLLRQGGTDCTPGAADNANLKLIMVHAPVRIDQAIEHGYDVYLTGHTHGGQICWPNGKPIHRHDESWQYCSGGWQKAGMQGYTSRGSGTSIVDARFFCPPEITLHTLIPGPTL